MNKKPNIAFFGTSNYSCIVLEEMKRAEILPKLIVTTPDRPQGRGLVLTPPPVKIWALANKIPCLQPENLKDESFQNILKAENFDVFIVISYGKIIPAAVINIPKHGALNIHASLLPKYRGASPIESAILANDRETGVTLMQIDEQMDHGPIIAERKVILPNWPVKARELGIALVEAGAQLLVETLSTWLSGSITPVAQDHAKATYTKKISKEDGLIDLADDPYQNFLKIQAYTEWPTAYFFTERNGKKIRVIIKEAEFSEGKLTIKRVIPEGKNEMDYTVFEKTLKDN